MITLDDIRAKAGDSISDKWRLLEQYIDQQRAMHESMTGPGLLKDQSGEGFTYRAAPQADAVFEGAFFVRLSGSAVTVGAGTVDGLTPLIDGTRIDGYDSEGKLGEIPGLSFEGEEPDEQLRSWICVEAIRADGDAAGSFAPIDDTDPAALIITHRASLSPSPDLRVSPSSLTGILPLAVVIWSDTRTPARVEQNVYFNQRTKLEDGELTFDEAA